jgi:hypothetical protein
LGERTFRVRPPGKLTYEGQAKMPKSNGDGNTL